MNLLFYWDDLTSEKQKEIIALLGDNQSWDVIPFCTLEVIAESISVADKQEFG